MKGTKTMTTYDYADDLEVCTACTMYLANGDVGDLGPRPRNVDPTDDGAHLYDRPDDDADQNPTTRHGELIRARWEGWYVVLSCDEWCEGYFSHRQCDGCGSRLGGDRHPAVAFRHVVEESAPAEHAPTLQNVGAVVK